MQGVRFNCRRHSSTSLRLRLDENVDLPKHNCPRPKAKRIGVQLHHR